MKVGRKPLGLTPEEWKVRRELQRKARVAMKREAELRALYTALITTIEQMQLHNLTTDEIIAELMKQDAYIIKSKPVESIAGYNGERLKRN